MKNVSETLKSACYFEMLCGGDRDVVTLMIVCFRISQRGPESHHCEHRAGGGGAEASSGCSAYPPIREE